MLVRVGYISCRSFFLQYEWITVRLHWSDYAPSWADTDMMVLFFHYTGLHQMSLRWKIGLYVASVIKRSVQSVPWHTMLFRLRQYRHVCFSQSQNPIMSLRQIMLKDLEPFEVTSDNEWRWTYSDMKNVACSPFYTSIPSIQAHLIFILPSPYNHGWSCDPDVLLFFFL